VNWNTVSAIAEMLGAIGVIATLLYLALQIRQNSRHIGGQAVVAMAQAQDKLTSEIRDDPELLRIVLVAARDWNDPNLTPEDLGRVSLFTLQEFQMLETAYWLMKQGLLDRAYYESRQGWYVRRLAEPGVQMWWKETRYNLSQQFVDHMIAQLAQSSHMPATSNPTYGRIVAASKPIDSRSDA
jgi:hypothetical protein